ncbi:MAG: hypothetical protein ACI92Z_001494 [Paracoccaceae bacterium]
MVLAVYFVIPWRTLAGFGGSRQAVLPSKNVITRSKYNPTY